MRLNMPMAIKFQKKNILFEIWSSEEKKREGYVQSVFIVSKYINVFIKRRSAKTRFFQCSFKTKQITERG